MLGRSLVTRKIVRYLWKYMLLRINSISRRQEPKLIPLLLSVPMNTVIGGLQLTRLEDVGIMR